MAKRQHYKFTALYDGKEVGTRTSPRDYKYAVVIQCDEEAAREKAYGEYKPTDTDRSNFDYATVCAAAKAGDMYDQDRCKFPIDQRMIDDGKRDTEGGWVGYCTRRRLACINTFERYKANGHYDVKVWGWSQSDAAVQKMAANMVGFLAIVDAVKTPIQHRKSNAVAA